MKDFLKNKHNVVVSTYITDKNPSSITTNGALTIIDNSDPDNNIQGLVPNSYSIFLDKLFLASGYGFSSYNQFETALYVISSYDSAYSYVLNKFNEINDKTFDLEYSYQDLENKFDKVYNTYGWLKEYKKINVIRKNANSYIISLTKVENNYINNTGLEIIGGENIYGQKYTKTGNLLNDKENNLKYNYFDLSYSAEIKFWFKRNNSNNKLEVINNAPQLYINNELIDFEDTNDGNDDISYIIRNLESPQTYKTQDITFICKRDDNIIYSYTFTNAIKWRYKILPFNTNTNNALKQLQLTTILALDNYNFNNTGFDSSIDDGNFILEDISSFIQNSLDNMIYLDDNTEIEFSGIGYQYDITNDENKQTINYFPYDYILVQYNTIKNDFYFNGIKNNSWNYIEFDYGQLGTYRLYQSPQRYIGKHTWTIKYNYE